MTADQRVADLGLPRANRGSWRPSRCMAGIASGAGTRPSPAFSTGRTSGTSSTG
jgi:hypothetical protein